MAVCSERAHIQYHAQRTKTDLVIKCQNLPLLLLAPVSLNCRNCNTYFRPMNAILKLGMLNKQKYPNDMFEKVIYGMETMFCDLNMHRQIKIRTAL